MKWTVLVVNLTLKRLTRILCRVDDSHLARVPKKGPLILVVNHVNFLEAPVVYTHLLPRPLTGLVKAETWNNLALRFLANLWGGIPTRRGTINNTAFQAGLNALKEGKILVVAPEGTRSGNGRLQRGFPGIVSLALSSDAAILPLVYYGGEQFWQNLPRLRRTDFNMVVGNPFRLANQIDEKDRAVRQQVTTEIMFQLAALLPPFYRGEYSNLEKATQEYLIFESGVESNLAKAQQPDGFDYSGLRRPRRGVSAA